jgi:murein DD-endopeptidase MepM/ murein hydrolase activator NlpD
VKRGHRAAAMAAALATTFSATAFAGGSTQPRGPVSKAEPQRAQGPPQAAQAFPMRAAPGYGDGLDAGRGHEGQDMFAPAGTDLVAVADAEVIETGSNGGAGNYVSIYSATADRTYNYFHMLAPALVGAGERVSAGQKLGELGCTGSCWGDHLHFEVRAGRGTWGSVLDPMQTLRRLSQIAVWAGLRAG